ncbi:MAG: hypothetical protein G01um101456_465 [Parcubacteria group bacterium Gr01-1014_56]|nr:MAG: hypothetical protein G01um101456_465 [Parcubacteria group bacterium Gr01-1014_56]
MSGGRGATSSPWRNIQTEGFVRAEGSGVIFLLLAVHSFSEGGRLRRDFLSVQTP